MTGGAGGSEGAGNPRTGAAARAGVIGRETSHGQFAAQAGHARAQSFLWEPTMAASILLAAFALCQTPPDRAVTDGEKKAFLKFLAALPTRGEFFTPEAVQKAAPHTRVLLALTEKDLERYDLYPFLALSAGLLGQKEARQYGTTHFASIAHPTIKLGWAIGLFRDRPPSPEAVAFLRRALDSKERARDLSGMLGPGFGDFREEVIRAFEAGKLMRVELARRHSIRAFPPYGGGFDYTDSTYVFAPGQMAYAVRPVGQRGELIRYDLAKGTNGRSVIPQPEGFAAKYDFRNYFDDPVLSVNASGDLLCRWAIEGNGDHGLAVLKRGSDPSPVKRVRLAIQYDSRIVAAPDGRWYLLHWSAEPEFTVYEVNKDLSLTRLGGIRRRQSASCLDARFIAKGVLHLFCTGGENAHRGLRCADFAVREKTWLHDREMLGLAEGGWLLQGAALQTEEGGLHYLWGIEDRATGAGPGRKAGRLTGLYYQAEARATAVKLGGGCHYRAVAVGDRVVICYTQEGSADTVFFLVVRHGAPGPVTALAAARGQEQNLWSKYMVLHAEAGRLWFVNTLTPNTLYELKLVDARGP
jgi:hypothetical protein